MKNQIVTVLTKSEFGFGINKYEGRLIDFGTRKYAQYNNAPFVDFIPKRKRKGRRILKTGYSPYLVILNGSHPDLNPNNPFQKVKEDSNVAMRKSQYSSFDSRYETDFDEILDAYIKIEQPEVLLDARNTKGFSAY